MSATFSELVLGEGPWLLQGDPSARHNIRIPMPDGVELIGDLYVPSGDGPWPIIVEQTPYGAAALGPLGHCYAAHGYLFLAVDVRGRFRSSETWDPLTHEKSDGPEVLRWAAALPECDGRVGTRGHSYSGQNQLMIVPHAGPCLHAMAVSVAPADAFENLPFRGGAYDLDDLIWAWHQAGPTGQFVCPTEHKEEDEEEEEEDERENAVDEAKNAALLAVFDARPFADADLRMGLRIPFFQEWIRHWRMDDFWRERAWLPDLPSIGVPSVHISGWWDSNGRGCVLAYKALGGASTGQRLVIGPWDHDFDPPFLDDLTEYEEALVKRAALHDAFTDELSWFEKRLMEQQIELPAVEVFVTGLWAWIEAEDWPPPGTADSTWFLCADGSLATEPGHESTRSYDFDPANPNPVNYPEIPVDLAPYDTEPDVRDDVLVYRTPPLDAAVLIMGDVEVVLNASTTALDVDWVARLTDEYPDGRSICVRSGILRARFRHGYDNPQPVTPNEPESYTINLWHAGHLFRKEHRIRVEIASSEHGRWDVNPGDGGDLAESTASVRSVQTIFHGGQSRSRLVLPVVPPATAEKLLSWRS